MPAYTSPTYANGAAVDAALDKALTAVQPQAGAVKLGGETAYLNIDDDGASHPGRSYNLAGYDKHSLGGIGGLGDVG